MLNDFAVFGSEVPSPVQERCVNVFGKRVLSERDERTNVVLFSLARTHFNRVSCLSCSDWCLSYQTVADNLRRRSLRFTDDAVSFTFGFIANGNELLFQIV